MSLEGCNGWPESLSWLLQQAMVSFIFNFNLLVSTNYDLQWFPSAFFPLFYDGPNFVDDLSVTRRWSFIGPFPSDVFS